MFAAGVFFVSNAGKRTWKPGKRVTCLAVFGMVNIDFRQAQLEPGGTRVVCYNIFGATRLRVPEGIPLKMSGVSLFGGTWDGGAGSEGEAAASDHTLEVTRFNVFGATVITK